MSSASSSKQGLQHLEWAERGLVRRECRDKMLDFLDLGLELRERE